MILVLRNMCKCINLCKYIIPKYFIAKRINFIHSNVFLFTAADVLNDIWYLWLVYWTTKTGTLPTHVSMSVLPTHSMIQFSNSMKLIINMPISMIVHYYSFIVHYDNTPKHDDLNSWPHWFLYQKLITILILEIWLFF